MPVARFAAAPFRTEHSRVKETVKLRRIQDISDKRNNKDSKKVCIITNEDSEEPGKTAERFGKPRTAHWQKITASAAPCHHMYTELLKPFLVSSLRVYPDFKRAAIHENNG